VTLAAGRSGEQRTMADALDALCHVHVTAEYVKRCDDEERYPHEAMAALAAAGVSARRGIMAAHLEPAYEGVPVQSLPNTETLTRDSLILPLHHALTADDQEYIVDVLRGLARA